MSTKIFAYPLPYVSEDFQVDDSEGRTVPPSLLGHLVPDDGVNLRSLYYAVEFGHAGFEGFKCSRLSLDYKLDFDPLAGDSFLTIVVGSLEPETGETYELDQSEATGGTFDIGVAGDMRTLGYDVSAAVLQSTLRDVYDTELIYVLLNQEGGLHIFMHWTLGLTNLVIDDANITGIFSVFQSDLYDADTPGVFFVDVQQIDSPMDWTTYAPDLPYPGEYIVQVMVSRTDPSLDVKLWLDNAEAQPVFGVTGNAPDQFQGVATYVSAGQFSVEAVFGYGPLFADIPTQRLQVSGSSVPVWQLQRDAMQSARVIFTLTLTGAADGLEDLDLPFSSFQHRIRVNTPAYLSCVIPNPDRWIEHIAARGNGQLVVRKGFELPGGIRQMEEIARANFQNVVLDRGSRSGSATVTGNRHTGPPPPKDWPISGSSFFGIQADGRRRIRAGVDLFLRPGDTCIYGVEPDDRLVVDMIQYTVKARPPSAVMEVVGLGVS